MDDYKHLLNPTSLYNTLFIKIATESLMTNETIETDLYWYDFMKKRYANSPEVESKELLNKEKSKYHPEFSKIIGISYGVVNVNMNGETTREIRIVNGETEKELLDTFFKILEIFRSKKLDGILCGHSILSYEIPFLIKRGLKNGLAIPKSIKNNLTAKPWEYSIVDIINLWKTTGNDYVSLEMIANFLDINTISNLDQKNTNEYLRETINIIIEVYSKLRNM